LSPHTRESVIRMLTDASAQDEYTAFDSLWQAVILIANEEVGAEKEAERIRRTMRRVPAGASRRIAEDGGVDVLLSMSPPLETILGPYEWSAASTNEALERLRARRLTDPAAALDAIVTVLSAIRNKRYHGFKSPGRPRDAEILSASRSILTVIVTTLLSTEDDDR
jgi:hypothetical protein